MVTGPKLENRSIRKSRSMAERPMPLPHGEERLRASKHEVICAGTVLDLRRLELHRLAATAGRDLVRVVEDELRLHLVDLVVHLGAEQEQYGLGIDQDLHALVLDDLVGRTDFMGIFHGVGLSRAAAVLDAHAQAYDL